MNKKVIHRLRLSEDCVILVNAVDLDSALDQLALMLGERCVRNILFAVAENVSSSLP